MEANGMPEKIYLFDNNDAMVTPLEGDTVYVREDAFIEKACEWVEKNIKDYIIVDIDKKYEGVDGLFFGGFRNYMKGE